MIAFACLGCGKPLQVKDELAGKKVKCPGCGKPLAVPLARLVQPSGASSPAEERTLPPRNPGQTAKDSLSDAAGQTATGAGPNEEATRTLQAPTARRELYDFLAPAELPDEIGRLGGYRILKVLGAGGMGVVFQAEDPKLKRKLAIKAMLPALAASETAKQRFLREAQTAAAIEHDNIVPIFQVGEDRGVPFIAMPFLKGEPLDERLNRERALPIDAVLRIGREAAKGLAAAHAAGLVHRDIKPANLWLEGDEGRVKILDFGLARASSDNVHLTQQGAIIGTPAYMAPEQAAGQTVDGRCDLFSLGCVLYRLSTGQPPFKGADIIATLVAVTTEHPRSPSELRPELPRALSDLMMQLLAKKPEQRPASAQAVAAALQEIEKQQTTEWPARPGPKTAKAKVSASTQRKAAQPTASRPAKKRSRWPWLVGAGILCLGALGLALGLFFLSRRGHPPVSQENVQPEDGTKPAAARASDFKNSLGMEFVRVPKGKAWLGGNAVKPGDKEVSFANDFFLGMYEVTQQEWESVMGKGINPSHFARNGTGKEAVKNIADADLQRFPVEKVSWHDCQEFMTRLNEKVKENGWVYRLPTEEEWEYACRGGPAPNKADTGFAFYLDHPTNSLQPDKANYEQTALGRTCKVGSYPPNRLGLHDMHGNVGEWCLDAAVGPEGAPLRVNRGGSWPCKPRFCHAARRHMMLPGFRDYALGLRVARVPVVSSSPKKYTNSLGMEFALVPRGKSWLGGGAGKPGEQEVTIPEDFYLGVYEVTQEEWQKVVDSSPSHFPRPKGGTENPKRLPVEMVSWYDAKLFMVKLNDLDKQAGWVYRLPSEVEWEYACRGGPMADKADSAFDYYFEKPSNQVLGKQANILGGIRKTSPVGSYAPNSLGLYDMHGNVWEWCKDEVPDPINPNKPSLRVGKGGSWNHNASWAKAAARRKLNPPTDLNRDIGLRVARVPIGK